MQYDVDMKKQKIYELLMDAIQENSLQKLQEKTEEVLRLPFVVCDNNYNVLMQIPEKYYDDDLWDSMLNYKVVIPEMVSLIQKDKYQESLDHHDNMLYIDYGIGVNIPRIVSTIHFEEKIVGYICVLLVNKNISDELYERVSIVTKFFSIYLSKHIAPSIPNHDFYFYLQKLFTNDITKLDYSKNSIQKKTPQIEGDFVIAFTRVLEKSNEIVYLYQVFNHVNKQKNIFPILDDNHLFILFTKIKGENTKEKIASQIEEILEITKVSDLQFGISEVFQDIHEVPKYKKQAIQAYSFIEKESLHFFHDILIEDMYKQVKDHDQYNLYLHPAIQKIIDYDKAHNCDYLSTLEVFLKQFCSSADTCHILNIHRNSLLYRLDKIQEIGEFSIKDKQTLIQLLSNFYIYKKRQ